MYLKKLYNPILCLKYMVWRRSPNSHFTTSILRSNQIKKVKWHYIIFIAIVMIYDPSKSLMHFIPFYLSSIDNAKQQCLRQQKKHINTIYWMKAKQFNAKPLSIKLHSWKQKENIVFLLQNWSEANYYSFDQKHIREITNKLQFAYFITTLCWPCHEE